MLGHFQMQPSSGRPCNWNQKFDIRPGRIGLRSVSGDCLTSKTIYSRSSSHVKVQDIPEHKNWTIITNPNIWIRPKRTKQKRLKVSNVAACRFTCCSCCSHVAHVITINNNWNATNVSPSSTAAAAATTTRTCNGCETSDTSSGRRFPQSRSLLLLRLGNNLRRR